MKTHTLYASMLRTVPQACRKVTQDAPGTLNAKIPPIPPPETARGSAIESKNSIVNLPFLALRLGQTAAPKVKNHELQLLLTILMMSLFY